MTAVTEIPKKIAPKNVAPSKSVEAYLKENFPLQGKEIQVDFRPVGGNNFRVNFWEKVGEDGAFCSHRIGRSYYVVCSMDDDCNWTHKVLAD